MSSIEDQIRTAASQNAELLAILSKTDYAAPALTQQNAYIKQLEESVARTEASLKKLSLQREKEHKDHKKYNESVTRRFLYKASGRKEAFAGKAEKEEREYFDALKAEHQAQDQREKLSTQMKEAQQRKADLEPDALENAQAQKHLDDFYSAIFTGETPSHPEEDMQENTVQEVQAEHRRLEEMAKAEEQVLGLLTGATKMMAVAQYCVQDALSYSQVDMFGGGAMWDYMERSALGKADRATSEVYRLYQQAQALSPHVQPLPQTAIAQGQLLGDILFDNFFSDIQFHQHIKASAGELQCAAAVLRQNLQSTQQRASDLKSQMVEVSRGLTVERQKLQRIREEIFANMAQPPPGYADAAFS